MNDAQTPNAPKSQMLYWTFQLSGWGLYTASRYIGGITVIHLPWLRFGVEILLIDALALGLTHAMRSYARRHQWGTLPLRKRIVRVFCGSVLCAIPLGILTQFSDVALLMDPGELLEGLSSPLKITFALPVAIGLEIVNWMAVFLIWFAIYYSAIALREYRSAQLIQSELARSLHLAELRLLKSQLNPHFLFNALNTVRSLIADHPMRAQNAVTHLANTLRYTLSSRQGELVTLAQEMDIVADYLQLETLRFEERLRVETHIPNDAAAVRIPIMLLQTLVENAIKHGIAELPAGGLLRIDAEVSAGKLVLEVENPRPAAPLSAAEYEGVGLHNARDRLRLLFGEQAALELDLSQPNVATARLTIPTGS